MKILKLPFFVAILTLGFLNSCGTDGCTDPTATNYNSDATKDDGSCEFAATEYKLSGTLSADQILDASVVWTLEGESYCTKRCNFDYSSRYYNKSQSWNWSKCFFLSNC